MRRWRRTFLMLLIAGIFSCATNPVRKETITKRNVLKKVKVQVYRNGARIVLSGTQPTNYTAFRLIEPWRVVLDLTNTNVRYIKPEIEVSSGIIKSLKIQKFGKSGRIEITTNLPPSFEVKREGNDIKMSIVERRLKKKLAQAEEEVIEELEEEEAPAEEEMEAEEPEKEVVEEAPEEAVEEAPEEVTEEVTPPAEAPKPEEVPPAPEVAKPEEVLPPEITKPAEVPPAPEVAKPEEVPPAPEVAKPEEIPPAVTPPPALERASKIIDIKSSIAGDKTIIEFVGNGPIGDYTAFKLQNPPRLVVDIMDVGNLYPSTTLDVGSPLVSKVRLGQHPDKVRFVLDVPTPDVPPYEIEKKENKLVVTLSPLIVPPVVAEVRKIEEKPPEVAPPAPPSPAPSPAVPPPPPVAPPKAEEEVAPEIGIGAETVGKKKYTGMRISLEFKEADIRDVFRLIAEVSKLNIIVTDDVKGNVTVRMKNVPWDQALDVILNTNNLGMVRVGNVVRISPLDRLRKEEKERLEFIEETKKKEPLITRLIPVNYASASEISSQIKPLLTERGTIQVDARTNTIIVKDVKKTVDEAEKLVRTLDLQTPQVLIEARIVEANTNFTRELGVQWGGRFSASPQYGTPTGLYFPNTIGVTGFTELTGRPTRDVGSAEVPNFVVNLPASVGIGTGGGIGFTFGSLNNSAILDLRLSAMESVGEGKVISSPRVVTLDNREAEIKQGISIPFETVSQAGTQTQFIDATLSLKVTPHVTADRTVIMKIKAEKNAPNTSVRSAGGVPSIDKKEASTEILIRDGETAVIGGIYTITKSKTVAGVPWFSRIPVIGWLFRKTTYTDETKELVVFITPRVIIRE
jgi:type IV pilus secretin PilQ/predicted competence protein